MALFVEQSNPFAEARQAAPQASPPAAPRPTPPAAPQATSQAMHPAAQQHVPPVAPQAAPGAVAQAPVASVPVAQAPVAQAPAAQPPVAAPRVMPTQQFPQAHYPSQVPTPAMGRMPYGGGVQVTAPQPGFRLINEEELKLLNAIAALQIRYGKPEEAIAWLALVRKQYPGDYQSARLYAVALMKLNRFSEAARAISELERIETQGGLSLLYRSLLEFKNNQIASARNWFQKFLGQRSANTASRQV